MGNSMLCDLIDDAPHAEEAIFSALKASGAPVVLFGAGDLAWYIVAYLRQNDIEPVCLCDNDPGKQGRPFLGLPVCGYNDLKHRFAPNGNKYNLVVSAGPNSRDAIYGQLTDAQEKNPIYDLRGYELCGEKLTYRYFREHIAQFDEAYASLADDLSRKVFCDVLKAKLTGDFSLYEAIRSKTQHFDPDLIDLGDHEVLLDVGAYRGDAILAFARRTEARYGGIIALEPDATTFRSLQNTVAAHGIDRIELHNKGAWDKHVFLSFHDGREGSSRVSESNDAASSAISIEVDTIDNLLEGRRVTYFQVDIEGAEHSAIVRAERTIRQWRPRMAVCVYHRREDLYDILLLLKSFVPEYKFHVRHYTDNQTETVLYAL